MSTDAQVNSVPEAQKNDKEYNFAQIRQQLAQERAARLQAEERAAELERVSQSSSKYRSEESDDEDESEPYVDHRILEKKLSKFEQKMEQKIDQKAEMKARALLDEERRSNYLKENDDFNEVMTSENVEKFANRHPGLAKSILNMPESWERQKLVYENIKALNVNKPEMKQPSIQDKIDANRRGPYYQPSGVASAPYASAGDFSPAGQKNAYEKLQQLKSQLRI